MREILLHIEQLPAVERLNGTICSDPDGVQASQEEWNEHIGLLIEDGFLKGETVPDHQGRPRGFLIYGLTMQGHNFIANARNNTVWKKVIAEAQEKGMSVGSTVLDKLLQKAMQKYLGLGE